MIIRVVRLKFRLPVSDGKGLLKSRAGGNSSEHEHSAACCGVSTSLFDPFTRSKLLGIELRDRLNWKRDET
jgi:hypothetical protein